MGTIKYREEVNTLKAKIKDLEYKASDGDREQLRKLEDKVKDNENLELELAFYKAEKQRMDGKFEFQEKNTKQTKELNKELQKAVKQEKEKVRRMSQQLDANQINQVVQHHNDTDELKQEVDKLKHQLQNEQMEKEELQQKLSNAESTHVNKLLQYVGNNNNDNPPPPPKVEKQNGENDEDDEHDINQIISPISPNADESDGDDSVNIND